VTGRSAEVRLSLLPRAVLLVFIATALHVALLHRIAPFGVVPGSLLVLTTITAIETGSDLGALVGFLSGMALNVITLDSPFGVASLIFCVTGWLVGAARDYAFPGAERVPFALVAVASFFGTSLYGLLLTAARGFTLDAVKHLGVVVLVTLVLNPIISLILGPLVRRVLGVNWNETS
jgi:rod shape-determining protein MreD